MKLSLIVAAAQNGVIGRNNQMPWHLPEDFKYFKATTLGKPIIMGRKTFESIGKPLPGRTSIVVTRQQDWSFENVLVAQSVEAAIEIAKQLANNNEVMVIGGAEIYRQALPAADRVYLTCIDEDVEGDAYFAKLNNDQWQLTSEMAGDANANLKHRFLIYDKR